MTTAPPDGELEHRVRDFAEAWLQLASPGIGQELVADPILVLGPQGTSAVPRSAFLAAVTGRRERVSAATTAVTTLTAATATPVSDQLVLATITWSFGQGTTQTSLVSDFLLQRADGDRLRCLAYLPRTNVLDHLT